MVTPVRGCQISATIISGVKWETEFDDIHQLGVRLDDHAALFVEVMLSDHNRVVDSFLVSRLFSSFLCWLLGLLGGLLCLMLSSSFFWQQASLPLAS